MSDQPQPLPRPLVEVVVYTPNETPLTFTAPEGGAIGLRNDATLIIVEQLLPDDTLSAVAFPIANVDRVETLYGPTLTLVPQGAAMPSPPPVVGDNIELAGE
jgi:hypothetical protein